MLSGELLQNRNNLKKTLFLFFTLIFFLNALSAQEISGTVINSQTGQPLANVNIIIPETQEGQVTDSEGAFSLQNVDLPLTLEFSSLGFRTQQRTFNKPESGIIISLQPEIGELSEVILRSANIKQELRKTPAAVGIITAKDLKRKDNFNLVQNFNYVPGVYVNQGALNTNKINIRGIGSRSQYSTNRIKAYINGIPITTAEGELTLDDLDPEMIDRIEIFKGPVSSVFGAGLGGAVNLYTDYRRRDQKSLSGAFSYGSFNTRKYHSNLTYVQDSLDLSVNYNKFQSDSYRENGAYDRVSISGNAGYLTKGGNYWSFFFSYANLKAFIPSSLNEDDFRNDPQSAAFTWYQAAGYESYSRNIMGLSYEHNFSEDFTNQTSVFFNSRDGYEPRPFDILDEDRNSVGIRSRFNQQLSLFEMPAEFSFGTEVMWEFYKAGTYENLYQSVEERRSVQGDLLSQNSQDRNYMNLFAQVNFQPIENMNIEAGLNFNSTAYELSDEYTQDEIDQSGDYRFDPVFSPRLGVSYDLSDKRTIYASVSHGFSTPSVAETLTPEGLINTDLKTETGLNYEAGFKGSWLKNRLYTELNLYSIQIRNLLVARRVGQDQYVGVNAGKADHNGIEFTSSYSANFSTAVQLNLFLNSNFNFYEFDQFVDLGENYSGNELPGIPEYMITPGMELVYQELSAKINYEAFGEMALNDANSEYTSAYQLLNLKLDYDFRLGGSLDIGFNFGINNILDEHYAASVVTNAIGFGGSAPRYYYPGEPRNYFGGVSLKYNL